MGNYTMFGRFENPRRGMQARNLTKIVPKILDLKSSSEQTFSKNCRWVGLKILFSFFSYIFPSETIHLLLRIILESFKLHHFFLTSNFPSEMNISLCEHKSGQMLQAVTALFTNMRILQFKSQLTI